MIIPIESDKYELIMATYYGIKNMYQYLGIAKMDIVLYVNRDYSLRFLIGELWGINSPHISNTDEVQLIRESDGKVFYLCHPINLRYYIGEDTITCED